MTGLFRACPVTLVLGLSFPCYVTWGRGFVISGLLGTTRGVGCLARGPQPDPGDFRRKVGGPTGCVVAGAFLPKACQETWGPHRDSLGVPDFLWNTWFACMIGHQKLVEIFSTGFDQRNQEA